MDYFPPSFYLFCKQIKWDLVPCSNIEWKSLNNTYLNIIELLFLIFFSNLKIIELENLVVVVVVYFTGILS